MHDRRRSLRKAQCCDSNLKSRHVHASKRNRCVAGIADPDGIIPRSNTDTRTVSATAIKTRSVALTARLRSTFFS
jgi:hypothetical protein